MSQDMNNLSPARCFPLCGKHPPLDGDKVYNFDKKRPLFNLYPLAPVTQGQSFIHLLINYRGGNMYGTGNNPAAGRRPLRL